MSARFRRCFATFVLILSGMIAARAAFAETTYSFNLPEQALADSLRAIGQQTEMNILFEPEAVKNARSPALRGQYTVDEAIRLVLIGTKLEAQHTAASNVVIKVKSARSTALPATSDDPPVSSGTRLAQSNASDQSQPATGPQNTDTSNSTPGSSKNEGLSEIVVTGTLIHNVAPISPVTVITSADLRDKGYTTLADAIFDLPQNFQAGASPASNTVFQLGSGSQVNRTYASGVNLRGIGAGATLVLLNGNRMAPTATGTAVDISQIPMNTIDRIEIVTDGASSLYGSDAIAGVVNIITKKDFSGVEVGARSTGIASGKAPDYGASLTAGSDWGSGGVVAAVDYEKDNPLWARNRSFIPTSSTIADPFALTPEIEKSSYYLTIHQSLTDRLTLSADGLYTRRVYETQSVFFGSFFTNSGQADQGNVSARAEYKISSDWTAALIAQYAKEGDHSYLTFAPASPYQTPIDYGLQSVEPRIDGKLFSAPGGDARIAIGGEFREESLHYNDISSNGMQTNFANSSRHIVTAYGELLLPIVGPVNALPFAQVLRADISGRFDHYSDFGSTTNPKLGLEWVPIKGATLHATWGRSFQAPTLYEASGAVNQGYVANVPDPNKGPNGSSLVFDIDGTNPNLQPETAKTFTAGMTIEPGFANGLNIDLSYFSINFKGQINRLLDEGYFYNVLQVQSALGSLVQLNPTPTQVDAQFNVPGRTIFNFAGPVGSYGPAPYSRSDIIAIVDIGYVNAASVDVKGLDLAVRYVLAETPIGRFTVNLDGSYYLHYQEQLTPNAVPSDVANTLFNPLRFRAKANLGWNMGSWATNLRVNYANAYSGDSDPNCFTAPDCAVSSWTTVDLGASYTAPNSAPTWLRGIRIGATATNLFARRPPFVSPIATNGLGYDPLNANPLQRTFAITLSKRWGGR